MNYLCNGLSESMKRDPNMKNIPYPLSESEFITLQRHHVFDILNERFHLWIDDGEAETVTAEQLKDAYSAINLLNGEWKKAVDKAIKYKTCAYLVF